MRTPIIAILVFIGSTVCWSSPQVPDLLVFKGDTVRMYNLILEEYLIAKDSNELLELFGFNFRQNSSFNCWRGYQAIYSIESDSLFLTHIIDCGEEFKEGFFDIQESKDRISVLFPNQINSRVLMNWYYGGIDIPLGDFLRWDGIFYGIPIEVRNLQVQNGLIIKDTVYKNYIDDNKKLNRRQKHIPFIGIYLEFKNNIDWSLIPKDDDFPFLDVIIVLGEDGLIDSIKCDGFCDDEDDQHYLQAIRKALVNMPPWDIIMYKGKPIAETFYYSHITFDQGKKELTCWQVDDMIIEAIKMGEPFNNER